MINVQKFYSNRRPSKKNARELCGRTENNRVVNFPAERNLSGQFADVLIIEALPNSLRGKLVSNTHPGLSNVEQRIAV